MSVPAQKQTAIADKRAAAREESLRWLATSQAERELAERLEMHRELAFGARR